MSALMAIGFATVVTLVVSTALSLVIYRPLQALLAKVCAGDEAVQFWARFTLIMLFLAPLLVSIGLGVPSDSVASQQSLGALVQQILSTTLFGSVATMLGMGLWVSALIRRAPLPSLAKPFVER
jgi:hypothetical protein